jgi:hypothetical protein
VNRPPGAPLSIKVRIGRTCRVMIQRDDDQVIGRSELSLTQLADQRRLLRQSFDAFRKALAVPKQNYLPHVLDALRQLHQRGRQLLREMFGQNLRELNKATDLCRAACPNWRDPGWNPKSLAPPLIEVHSPWQDGIPIDMLPLLDHSRPGENVTMDELARLAGSFLGFSAVVQRGLSPPREERLENTPRLPLRMFCHHGLSGVKSNREFFSDNVGHIEFAGLWPASSIDGTPCQLAHRLWDHHERDTSSPDGWPPGDKPVQICYFMCHCDTNVPSPENYALRLSPAGILGGLSERRIELGALNLALGDLRSNDLKDQAPRPLVFLNACASGDADPAGVGSFPQMFRDHGFLGFIGTEAVIPEAFASIFAAHFFAYLLEGEPLGNAVRQARWRMLKDYKNPLGLLYTVYADPALRVRKPADQTTIRRPTTA